jgi:hypothetical protein
MIYLFLIIQQLNTLQKQEEHECYSLDSLTVVKGQQLKNAFANGCLELSFKPISGRILRKLDVYNKVATNTDLQLPLKDSVHVYQVVMDIPHNLLVSAGNYASELVCNN